MKNPFGTNGSLIQICTHKAVLQKRLLNYSRRYPSICRQTDADPEATQQYAGEKIPPAD